MPKGHRSLSITASGTAKEFTKLGDKLLGKLDLVDKKSILRESGEAFSKASIKGVAKGTLKSMGKSLKKGLSFGVNGVVKDAKALINAKGAGKIIPGLNIAAGAVEVVQGISKSEKQARKDGLKGQEITASKVGGALVDVGKVAVTTAMIGAATALLPATASIGAVVGVGIIAGWTANTIDKKLGVTSEMKKGVKLSNKKCARMVFMIKNYVPTKYKNYNKKPFTKQSAKKVLSAYLLLLISLIVIQIFDKKKETHQNFLSIQSIGAVILFVLSLIVYLLFDKKNIQKYLALIMYFSSILFTFFAIAFFSFLAENPVKVFIESISLLFILLIFLEFVYMLIVFISLKINNLNLRDMVAMFIMNGVSLLGIGLIVLSEAKDNISFGVFGATAIIAGLLILATFHYPRVLHYWKRQSDIDSNVSVYGNSIEMMKNKRTKK